MLIKDNFLRKKSITQTKVDVKEYNEDSASSISLVKKAQVTLNVLEEQVSSPYPKQLKKINVISIEMIVFNLKGTELLTHHCS